VTISRADAQRLNLLFERGLAAHRTGRVDEAAGCYRAVLARVKHAPSFLNLGRILAERNDLRGALALYEQALALAPEDPERLGLFAGVAAALGEFDRSLPALQKLVAQDESNAGRWQSLGWTLLHLDRAEEAVEALRRASELAPDRPEVMRTYASALFHAGRRAEADEVCRSLAALLPPEQAASFMVDPVDGEPLAQLDPAAVRHIYQNSAQRYETRTVPLLRNRTPELLSNLLDAAVPGRRFGAALDLGCGTGLLGARLRERVDHLTGVDLSPAMLAEARRKEVYDDLLAEGMIEFLSQADRRFDLVTASDVLIYLGDLAPFLAGFVRCAGPGALLLFSTERATEGHGFRLNAAGRFTHDPEHVLRLATGAGLRLVSRADNIIRYDHVHPVTGDLFLLGAG
jgi:predicted TPR repeat methyltransferase